MTATTIEFEIKKAVRSGVRILFGLAGGTGSGKTWSSLVLAKGMAGGKRFGLIDTENGRASMYADYFDFDVLELTPPFSPERYLAAIKAMEAKGYPVIVVDQFSHEWEGTGGILDQHESDLREMVERSKKSGDSRPEYQIEESHNMRAWIEPKMAHKRMMTYLTQMGCHLILNFRAEDKVEIAKEKDDKGRMKTIIRPKQTLTGTDGWVPICERRMPFELTISLLLTADAPGVPVPIKIGAPHKPFFSAADGKYKLIDEESGRQLAAWAKGSPVVSVGADGAEQGTAFTHDELLDLQAGCEDAGTTMEKLGAWLSRNKLTLETLKPTQKASVYKWIEAQKGKA